jgi:hypothetical protein
MRRKVKAVRHDRLGQSSVRFRPPAVQLSDSEFLLPIVHTNSGQLGFVARQLDGSTFHVKVVDPIPQSIPGGHMVMAKFKAIDAKAAEGEGEPPFRAEGKVTGRILGEVQGIEVTANIQRAKRSGKDRVWFQIRQRGPKRWRVSETLSYARAVDVQFEGN